MGSPSPAPPMQPPPSAATPIEHANTEDLRLQIARIEEDDRKASDFVDKIVLVGGTADIVASATFLKDIATAPAPGSLRLLNLSWVLLLTGAALGFLSLFTTRAAARALRRMLATKLVDGISTGLARVPIYADDYRHVRRPNLWTRWCTRGGVAAFVGGIGLLALFASANLPAERPTREQASPEMRTFIDSLRNACRERQCVLIFGYDYDLPRLDTAVGPALAPRRPND